MTAERHKIPNKQRFKVGDWVSVRKSIRGEKEDWSKRGTNTVLYAPSLIGQVVGISTIQEGVWDNSDMEGGSYFVPTKIYEVWLVRLGIQNKELKVLDEDISHCLVECKRRLPILYQNNPWVSTKYFRDLMREEMKNWPRDEKGRWIKK